MKHLQRTFAAAALCALTACAGGSPSSAAGATLPAVSAAAPRAQAPAPAALLTIVVPRAQPHPKGRPHFVPPSVASASLEVAPDPGCKHCTNAFTADFGLTPQSPNCQQTAAGTKCTISLELASGGYAASLSLYDGPLTNGSPTGYTVSVNQSIPMTIAKGKANAIGVTLYGVPHSLKLVNADSRSVVRYGSPTTVGVVGTNAHTYLLAYALDVDGDFILGPGAPAFDVTPGGGFTTSVTGNSILLTSPAAFTQGASQFDVLLKSPACSDTAAAPRCSYQWKVAFDPLVAIVTNANSIAVEAAGTGTELAVVHVTAPISDLAFDAHGNLFVASQTGKNVEEFAAPIGFYANPTRTIAGGIAPSRIAFDRNGNLFIADASTGSAKILAPPYTGTAQAFGPVGIALGFALDAGNNMWVAYASDAVEHFQPPYVGTSPTVSVINRVSDPVSIAVASNGNLEVANASSQEADAYSAPFSNAAGTLAGFQNISQVAASASTGVAICQAHGVGIYDPTSMALAAVPPAAIGTTPCHAAFDVNDELWLTDPSDGIVYGLDYPWQSVTEKSTGWTQPGALAVYPPV